MALSLKKQILRALAKKDAIVACIYGCAKDSRTPFQACLKLAPQEWRDQYEAICVQIASLEESAISTGKAWRASFGMLTFYR